MPCYTEKSLGTKMLTIFPENSKLGLPSIDGLVILNDLETGKTLSVMDGQTVTAFRTGAVGGVGIRHLSRKDCHTVGIIGAGVQGFHLALYACAARDIHTVYIYNHSYMIWHFLVCRRLILLLNLQLLIYTLLIY